MTTFDPAPLWRSTIGFDRLFDLLNASRQWTTEDNYPPYNIERTSENRYEISLAGRARDRFVTISSYLDSLILIPLLIVGACLAVLYVKTERTALQEEANQIAGIGFVDESGVHPKPA